MQIYPHYNEKKVVLMLPTLTWLECLFLSWKGYQRYEICFKTFWNS